MRGVDTARIKEELGNIFFDPAVPDAPNEVEVPHPDTDTFNDVQNLLEKHFRTHSTIDAVTLVAHEERLGVVTRASLGSPGMTAASTPTGAAYELGSGERLSLPGFSTRYKLLKFRCRLCADEIYGMHYDVRGLQACGQGHRQWEFQREA